VRPPRPLSALLAFLACLPVSLALADEGSAAPSPETRAQRVRDYLAAPSKEAREALAPLLEALDALPVDEVTRLIRATRSFEKLDGTIRREVAIGKEKVPYLVRLPQPYDPSRAYPLLYSVWGPGVQAQGGIGIWAPAKEWIVVSPSLPADHRERAGYASEATGNRVFPAVLGDLLSIVHFDADRVFVSGFSHGASMAWFTAGFLPDRLAGAVPAAGTTLLQATSPPGSPSVMENLLHVPVYFTVGLKDEAWMVEQSRATEKEMTRLKLSHVYREFPEMGHDFPREEMPRILEWMSQQRRDPWPKRVRQATSALVNSLGRAFWIQLVNGDPGLLLYDARIVEGNRIEIETQGVRALDLLLSDRLVDCSKEIVVAVNGTEAFRGTVRPSCRLLLDGYRKYQDPVLLYSVVLPIKVP